MKPAQQKPVNINKHTGRPDTAYSRQITQAEAYVNWFSRALCHKPALTLFGTRLVRV